MGITHIDLFSNGAMALAALSVFGAVSSYSILYSSDKHTVRTFGLNRSKLPNYLINIGLEAIQNSLGTYYELDLLTATLFQGIGGSKHNRSVLDDTQVIQLVQTVSKLKPKKLAICASPELGDPSSPAYELYHYIMSALRGMGYSTKTLSCDDAYINGGTLSRCFWIYTGEGLSRNVEPGELRNTLKYKLAGVQPSIGSKYSPDTALVFQKVRPGDTYSGDKFRRLRWSEVCPALHVNMSGARSLCHPDELRPLNVSEVKRLKGYPDNWQLAHNMRDQYKCLIQGADVRAAETILRTL